MTFEWDKSYETGDAETDEQHQELFKLAAEFMAANSKDALVHCAMRLYQHTRVHFEREEQLLLHYRVPNAQDHINWHNLMISRLNAISASIHDGTLQKQDLQKLMDEWALFHIPVQDQALARYIAESVSS
jgi:hemerythrin-like metal-binding protein